MKKRFVLLVLAVVLIAAGIIAGCATKTQPVKQAEPAKKTEPAAKTADTTPAAQPSRTDSLIEGAKKEGKLVIWNQDQAPQMEKVLDKFREKYPFIKVELWRAGSDAIHEKIFAEARAGQINFDVAGSDIDYFAEVMKLGLAKKYDWPNTKEWDRKYVDPEGYWITRNILPVVIAYNTNLVSEQDAPKNWEDVLDPKWKGKVNFDTDAQDVVLMMMDVWGKEKTVDYLTKLAPNAILIGGANQRAERLAQGADHVGVRMNLNQIMDLMDKGAPLKWVKVDPVFSKGTPMFIAAKAPHPNAAMLYADWFTSLEGQQAYYNELGKNLPHPKVKGRLNEALEGLNVKLLSMEGGQKYSKEANEIFQKIFLK